MKGDSFDVYVPSEKKKLWELMEDKASQKDRSLANYINYILTKYHRERGYDV